MKKFLALIGVFLIVGGVGFYKFRERVIASTLQTTLAAQEPWQKKVQAYYYKIAVRSSVYDFLRTAYYMFGVRKGGLIHIGARDAEELGLYQDHDVRDILWIEADLENEAKLRKIVSTHPGSKVAMFAASDKNGTVTLHQTSNAGHSSSILPLKNHLKHYPGIKEAKAFDVPAKRLDDYLSVEDRKKYNVIVMDIQGAELIALKGAVKTLETIDAIIAETNYDALYEGAVLIQDLDAFLSKHGFVRTDSVSVAFYTGDALYVKKKFFLPENRRKS